MSFQDVLRTEAAQKGWKARSTPFFSDIPLIDGVEDSGFTWIRRHFALVSVFSERPASSSPLDPSFDWKDQPGVVGTPRDQGMKNATCMAHAACAVAEARLAIKSESMEFSPRYLHFCAMQQDRQSTPRIEKLAGTLLKNGLPVTSEGDGLDDIAACQAISDLAWSKVPAAYRFWKPEEVKREISRYGPVLAIMDLREDFLNWYTGADVYRATPSSPVIGRHAVCFVGYDDADQCWIGMNSLGPDWGDGGFFKIGYEDSGVLTPYAIYSFDMA